MALSKSVQDKIAKAVEEKKTGQKATGSSSVALSDSAKSRIQKAVQEKNEKWNQSWSQQLQSRFDRGLQQAQTQPMATTGQQADIHTTNEREQDSARGSGRPAGGFGSGKSMFFSDEELRQVQQETVMERAQEAAERYREDPTKYRLETASEAISDAAKKLLEADEKVRTVEEQGQALSERLRGINQSYTALQGLLAQYQKTGSDVDARAYILASQQYEAARIRYNQDVEQWEKNAGVYDQYKSALEAARKAQTNYTAVQDDYLNEHPAEKYQDASLLEIYGVMQGLRAEIDDDYEKAYANGTYKKWEDLNALYKQKALEQDNGLWNSGPVEFVDRALTATQAGMHDWLAGVEGLKENASELVVSAASKVVRGVAEMSGNETLKQIAADAEANVKVDKSTTEAEQKASLDYMQEALMGTGKIDGWIIQQMESVGAMWMDTMFSGMSGGKISSLQILGIRAAGSAMLEAQEKGYSTMQQLFYGAAVGALEVVSEKLFGGNPLYDTDKGLVNQLVEKVTKNPAILRLMYSKGFDIMGEGLEEVFTEFLEPVAEAAVLGSADVDWASPDEIAQAFAGGVFLGLMGQSVDMAVNAAANRDLRATQRAAGIEIIQMEAAREVVAEGLQAEKTTDAYLNAWKLQKKLDAGKPLSAREIGKQLMDNQAAMEAGKLVGAETEPVQAAPEGTLKDPASGFYGILMENGEDGKTTFRLVEVAPDGSMTYRSNTTTDNLLCAKITAEIQGLNIRDVGTAASLRARAAKMEDAYREGADPELAKAFRAEEFQEEFEEKYGSGVRSSMEAEMSRQLGREPKRYTSREAEGGTHGPVVAENAVEINVQSDVDTTPVRFADSPLEGGTRAETVQEGIQWAGNMPETETVNGGIENGTEQQAAEQQVGVGGNQEWVRGNAAGQTARSPRQQFARDALRRAEEARRVQSHVQAVGGELVSLRELGLSTGSTDRTVWTVPKEAWTTEIHDAAEIAESEGLEFIPISGAMYVNYGKGEARINGAVENGKVFVQIDSTKMDAREITMHEVFHEKAAKDQTLVTRLVELIQEKYTKEQTEEMFQRYYDAYQEIYSGRASDKALEEMIWEEMLADAYAEFQRYVDADASQFGMDVQEAVWNHENTGSHAQNDSGTKYSFAGRNAKTADSETLAKAEQMEQDGAEAREIWDETGWYRGMDGQWKFEIDDSGMEFHRSGDAAFARNHPEYVEHQRMMNEILTGDMSNWTKEDDARLLDLDEVWGRERGRLKEMVDRGNATLEDILDHEELYKAYPQLRDTRVVFMDMEPEKNGSYDKRTNTIELSSGMRNRPESTLIHEIQHAIQDSEGFTAGSSPEYWASEMQRNERGRVEDPRITRAEKKYRDLFDRAPEEMKNKVREINRAKLNQDWDEVLRLEQEMYDGPYADLYSELEDANFAWRDAIERFTTTDPYELYKNTAGEIEARDAAKRRSMTPGQRRETMPDLGDENTVFANKARFSLEGHEDDLQDLLEQGTRQAATMEPVREMSGTEFAKSDRNLTDQVSDYFASIGNKAIHPVLGEVVLDRKGAKADIAHGIGRKKAAAFLAVPDVVEKGGMIDYRENWKGRGYDTAVLAAPVKIADQKYLMGVVLERRNGENQFYVHEILAESEEGAAPFWTGTIKDGTPGGDTPSVLSLLQKVMNVKRGNVRFSMDTKQTKEDKARARAERELAKGLGEIMSMPQSAVRELQEGIVRQIMEEYQQTGEIDREKLDTALSEAFAKGLIVDDEFYQQYKPVQDYLRSQALTISEQDRADIADFTDFRKRAFGTLKIVNQGGLPVDVAYQELQGIAPELFPMDITHPADQLVHMYEVCQEIKKVQVPLERAMGENADEFYTWAEKKMNDLVERTLEKYAKSVDWKPREQTPKEQKRKEISQAALERFEQAEREEIPVLQWAGQEEIEGFTPQEQQAETTPEAPQTLEQAANGTMRDWIQYVLSGNMTPEEFAEMNRNAKARELTGRAKEEAEKILSGHSLLNSVKRDEMTDEEVAALIKQFEAHRENAVDRNAQTVTPVDELIIRKADFTGTPAMEKLVIRIDGSVTRYRQTQQLREYEEAAYGASKMLNKRIRKMKATEQEKELARLIVEGTITADALDSRTVDIEKVAELADYFMAANSFKLDMIAQRRAEINTMNYRIASDMFRDTDAYSPQLPGVLKGMTKLVMNERTPERVVKQIFGQEQGGKIYETYFRPVWVNGAEMSRFESRMLDRVREFQDKDGKKRALTVQEREFAQRLMEGQAARDAVESLADESKEKVTAVAQNLNNGADFTEQVKQWDMVGDEYLQGLAQAYADYLDTVTMSKDMDQTILKNAIETYSQIYNELYEAVNDFLTSHGYKPIGFIKGYAPHFQKREVQQGLFGALKSLGVEKESVSELPASIAGRTADFKPNMKWNPHFQSRKGEKTSYDIEAGYEQYIHYVAEMFYHTDDVMRIRQAVNYFRQAYSSEDISQAIEDAQVDQFKDVAWKKDFLEKKELLRPGVGLDDRAINAAYEKYVSDLFDQAKPENLSKYSEFVTWMDNYANIVAGKQSMADRGIEYGGGRNALNIGSKLMQRFASANVAGNLSSVLNQTAQVPLIQQQLGKYMERAMWDMARGTTAKENFAERSDFLTDKRGVEKLTTDNAEKFISTLFKPAEMMDRMVSTLAVRGRYLQALDQGMTMEQAMKEADDFGRRVMGSRMKGAKPLAYESKTFINQMIHVFQVEASNTFDYMALSDMPQAVQQVYKTKGKAAGARYLASYIVGYLLNAFLLNQLTDKLYGGTPAPFDLMGWALNFVAGGWGLTDEEFMKTVTDNGLERIMGERPFGTEPIDRDSGFSWAGSISDLGYNVSNDLPYVRNVAGVLGLGDQSLPTVGLNELGESLGDAGSALWNQTFKGQEETGLTWAGTMQKVGEDLLSAAAQLIPGGRQLKKTAQGVKTMVQGGATSGYGDNQRLKYQVDQNVWNWARGILFGNAALDEYDAYYASGNQPLTAGQTQKVKELEGLGIERNISYELYQEFREINSDMTGVEASAAKRNAINDLDLTDDQKLEVFDRFFLDHTADSYEATRAEYQAMLDAGLTWNEITEAHNEYAALDAEEDMKATEKATALAYWVDQQGWNNEQIAAVKERYQFWTRMPAEATNYEKFTEAGMQGNSAVKLTEILAGLMPEDGRETVSINQKILAIQESDLTDDEKTQAIVAMVPERRERLVEAGVSDETARDLATAFAVAEAENGDEELSFMEKARTAVDMAKGNDEAMAALSTILQESTYGKLETAATYGVTARAWVDYREAWTAAYGSDSVSQEEVEKILDRMNLNDRQKAALWQIANKSWKPENNPYSVSVGEDIFDMLNEE